jgi:hypothetical protein
MTNYCHKIFLFATTEISTNKIPLIHQVIPYFDMITTALEDAIDNSTIPSAVHHAALRGYFMLNKYCSLTDDSIIYRIAMSIFSRTFRYIFLTNSFFFFFVVLHPRYKTTYFTRVKWPAEWTSAAEALIHKVWAEKYKKVTPSQATEPTRDTTRGSGVNDVCFLTSTFNSDLICLRCFQRFSAARQYFSALQDDSTPIDALEEWSNTPIINMKQDPITYWTGDRPVRKLALKTRNFAISHLK